MIDPNESYTARKRRLSNLDRPEPKRRNGLLGFAITFGGVWLLWGLFVFSCACTLLYVIFHFIAKFW